MCTIYSLFRVTDPLLYAFMCELWVCACVSACVRVYVYGANASIAIPHLLSPAMCSRVCLLPTVTALNS